jgi:hypothetical protein
MGLRTGTHRYNLWAVLLLAQQLFNLLHARRVLAGLAEARFPVSSGSTTKVPNRLQTLR